MTRLNCLGIPVQKSTSTLVPMPLRLTWYAKPGGTAYVIGEGGLLTALHEQGFSVVDRDPDFVVIGECRTFNAEMMEAALNLLIGGAKLIATNLDRIAPRATACDPAAAHWFPCSNRHQARKPSVSASQARS